MNLEMSEIKYPLKKNRFSYNRVYTVSLGTPCMCIRETNCYGVTQHQEHLSRCYTKPASWDSALRTCMSSMPRHGAKVRRSRDQDIDTLVPEEIDISMHANKALSKMKCEKNRRKSGHIGSEISTFFPSLSKTRLNNVYEYEK